MRYPHALDTCENGGNEFADLFTSDGSYNRNDGQRVVGHKALADMAGGPNCTTALSGPRGPLVMRHSAVNVVIEPSAEGAIGKSYFLELSFGENGQAAQIVDGAKYYDVYVKTPDGWRIKSRTFVRAISKQVSGS
jgi:hypothetical protein